MERGTPEWNELKAAAEAQMSKWLAHPDQFGVKPAKVEMVAAEKACWPYIGDDTDIQFVKYAMHGGETGIGITGPVTKSFIGSAVNWDEFEIEQLKIYYCGWNIASVSMDIMEDADEAAQKQVDASIRELIAEMTGHKNLEQYQVIDIEDFTFFEYRVLSDSGEWISSIAGYDEEMKEYDLEGASRVLPALYLFIGERFYRGSALKWLKIPLEEQAKMTHEVYRELFHRLLIREEVPSAIIEWLVEQGMSFQRAHFEFTTASQSVYEGIEKEQKGADQIEQLVATGMDPAQARDLVAGAMDVINSGEIPTGQLHPPEASVHEEILDEGDHEMPDDDLDDGLTVEDEMGPAVEPATDEVTEKPNDAEPPPSKPEDDAVETPSEVTIRIVDEDIADGGPPSAELKAAPEAVPKEDDEPDSAEPKGRGCATTSLVAVGVFVGLTWWIVGQVVG